LLNRAHTSLGDIKQWKWFVALADEVEPSKPDEVHASLELLHQLWEKTPVGGGALEWDAYIGVGVAFELAQAECRPERREIVDSNVKENGLCPGCAWII